MQFNSWNPHTEFGTSQEKIFPEGLGPRPISWKRSQYSEIKIVEADNQKTGCGLV